MSCRRLWLYIAVITIMNESRALLFSQSHESFRANAAIFEYFHFHFIYFKKTRRWWWKGRRQRIDTENNSEEEEKASQHWRQQKTLQERRFKCRQGKWKENFSASQVQPTFKIETQTKATQWAALFWTAGAMQVSATMYLSLIWCVK